MTVLAVIQARMSSRRCPGKVLAEIGGRPLLALLVARLRRARRLDRLVVATTTGPADDPVAAWAEGNGVNLVRGPEDDVLTRYVQVVALFPARVVVRVTADNPFTDPLLFDTTVEVMESGGFDYVHMPEAPLGSAVDAFSHTALWRCHREGWTAYQREHINAYVLDHAPLFRIGRAAPPLVRPDLRLTVDTPDDLAAARRLADRLPDPVTASLHDLAAAS